MNLFSNIIYGTLIGIGAIIPGISSGVICMILGIYEKLIDSIIGFFKDIKSNIKFLLPISVGAVIGIIIFSNIIIYCFNIIPIQTKSLFIGLLLGSIYILYKTNSFKSTFSSNISFFICFLIGIILILLESNIFIISNYQNDNILFLILSGFFMSIGIVVPGISSTVILMLLGIYNTYLDAISTLNLSILIPIGTGVILGSLLFLNIIKRLLNKFNNQTLFGIIGFSLGSILIIYPGYSFDFKSLIGVILLILGFLIGKNIKR